ncbi:MAG: SDR family NAD(P)-dependent oxidoreductase [Bacteroidota bacterium]
MKKSILITGSTDGIGKLAAINLAKDGYSVSLHGRNQDKLDKTIAEVKQLSGSESVDGFVADFSDLASVQKMASQVKERMEILDVLVNNAGVFNSAKASNAEGMDMRFVVNYLAPYLLTRELLPLLAPSAQARIINLSSAAQSPVSIPALRAQQSIAVREAYAQSKLALTMWSFHLADQQPNATVIALNPGSLLNTKMVREAFGRHWSSADKGAEIICTLATLESYADKSKTYFDNDQGSFGRAHSDAYDSTKIAELIRVTEELLT